MGGRHSKNSLPEAADFSLPTAAVVAEENSHLESRRERRLRTGEIPVVATAVIAEPAAEPAANPLPNGFTGVLLEDENVLEESPVYIEEAELTPPPDLGLHDRLLVKLIGARSLALEAATSRDRKWDLLGTALIVALAAILRFWALGRPDTLVFDETYYVKDAYTLWRNGFESQWPDNPNPAFEAGDVATYLDSAAFVVHPQVGKWLIALGMIVGGGPGSSFAWRLANAVFGVLAVWLVIRIARRLFASTAIGLIAGLLMAVEGGAIVHSRTALLDQFLMVFVLAASGCLLIDREVSRRRLAADTARAFQQGGLPDGGGWFPLLGAQKAIARGGPWSHFRWWRLLAGVLLGLACGVKWSGIYFLAVFGLLTVLWDLWARREAARVVREMVLYQDDSVTPVVSRRDFVAPQPTELEADEPTEVLAQNSSWFGWGLLKDGLPAFLSLVPVALLTYVASWFSWFRTPGAWGRDWALENPTLGVQWLPPLLRSFWQYHIQMWNFHTNLDAQHPYSSNPLTWLFQWRPTVFYWARGEDMAGRPGCDGLADCVATVTSLGNPFLWWSAFAAILLIAFGLVRRDWRALAALSGIIAGWTPWLLHMDRTIFTFYTIAFTPWMIFALCYVFTLLLELGRPRAAVNGQYDYQAVSDHTAFLAQRNDLGSNASTLSQLGDRLTTWGSLELWRPAPWGSKIAIVALVALILAVSAMFYPLWTAMPIEFTYWQRLTWLRSWI